MSLPNTEEINGWQHYMAPEYLRYRTYTKASDVYAFGMIMHTVGTGYVPYRPLCIDHYLTLDIVQGLRPKISHNIPKGFKNLIERCWNTEVDLRPNIHEICNILLNLWSSINRNKRLNSLNPVSLEFLAADNIDYSKTKSQETLSQRIENNKPKDMDISNIINLEPTEMINFIKKKNLVKFINKDELTTMKKIDSGHFGSISTAIWKKTDKLVVCKKIRNSESINKKQTEAFLHELDMHRRLDFCPRIIRVLGISFGKFIYFSLFVN
jgi:serine/threonine protein kinase